MVEIVARRLDANGDPVRGGDERVLARLTQDDGCPIGDIHAPFDGLRLLASALRRSIRNKVMDWRNKQGDAHLRDELLCQQVERAALGPWHDVDNVIPILRSLHQNTGHSIEEKLL